LCRCLKTWTPGSSPAVAIVLFLSPLASMMRRDTRRGATMRIGFVGTGTMGTPIASCLGAAGHSLSAFAAARDNEAVFTSLPGPAEFEAAMLEPQTGILAGLREGGAHIDLTTNS